MKLIAKNLWKRFFGETFVSHATRILCDTGYRRNSLREGGERERGRSRPARLIVETIKGRGGKKGVVVMRVVGERGKYPHGSAERDLETAEMAASISAFRMLEVLI